MLIAQLGFRSILITALEPSNYGRLTLILSLYYTMMIIGASGVPDGAARYIALVAPADDSGIVRSAIRAAIWPTAVSGVVIAVVAGILLKSPIACLFAVVGLSSLLYSLLTTGVLRGRGHLISAASVLPVAAVSEVGLLAALWFSGVGITLLSAFGVFCLGNLIGLIMGIYRTVRTAPSQTAKTVPLPENIPSSRQLLGFSMWLGIATIGIAFMPLVVRFGAAFDSYTVVAMVDIALVILSIPQRVGTIIVAAVIPHATRELGKGNPTMTISRREQMIMIVPFVLAAVIVGFTPVIGWLFGLLGRPEYGEASGYIALALLAGPARILYGLVQGVLAAHGEGRFLALNATAITVIASGVILAASILGNMMVGLAAFVIACWAVYFTGLARIGRVNKTHESLSTPHLSVELSPVSSVEST